MIHVSVEMPGSAWLDLDSFLSGLKDAGFVKSVGAGISFARKNKTNTEKARLITESMDEAVSFVEKTRAAQVANACEIGEVLLNGEPMLVFVWRYRLALQDALRMAKRLPGRRGVGVLRHHLELALTDNPASEEDEVAAGYY